MADNLNVLYVGPLRSDTPYILGDLIAADNAKFILPTHNNELWQAVIALLPSAESQVKKVGADAGNLPYYQYNLYEFNASQPASGLYRLYPGLVLLDSSKQPLHSIQDLLDEIKVHQVNVLIVDQPEIVWPLLQALESSPLLKQLHQLGLRVGVTPLYETVPETEVITDWYQQHGYELVKQEEEDPDLPLLRLTRHKLYQRWQDEVQHSAELVIHVKSATDKMEHYQNCLKESEAKSQQLQTQCEQQQQKVHDLQLQLDEQKALISQLQENLKKHQDLQVAVKKLHEALDNNFEEQKTYIQKTTNALGQHITRRTTR